MKKISERVFVCQNCGNEFAKWSGQCSACGEWNALKEISITKKQFPNKSRIPINSNIQTKKLDNNQKKQKTSILSTGIGELDRVLGKGIVPGQVVLFAGEPGIGKSTLLTQLVGKLGGLYVAGEETVEQINLRVERLGLEKDKFEILESNLIEEMEVILERTKNVFNLVVVDSIQMMMSSSTEGSGTPGSLSQIRASTFQLIEMAKKSRTPIFIVGHVTKDGEIAGPKILEHMVDTVLYFEGDRNSELRILRAEKNRFGATDEVGVFKMEEAGLREISAEEVSLIDSKVAQIGSVLTVVMEGSRPLVLEIQALVTESFSNIPKRVFSGIDFNRGQLLTAVTQKVLGIPLYKYDIFVMVSGGVKINDPGADLAIVAAMYSSYKNKKLETKNKKQESVAPVLIGEVSLLGKVKKVRGEARRIKEIKNLGREVLKIDSVLDIKRYC
jgi:DNA repair protein RadA/Sms